MKCAAAEFGTTTKHNVFESLRKAGDWNIIKEVMESFRGLSCSFKVHTLYELKHITGRFLAMKKGNQEFVRDQFLCEIFTNKDLVLSRKSVSPSLEQREVDRVQKDYVQLTMYPHRADDDRFFELFMASLSELVHGVGPISTRTDWGRSGTEASNNDGWSVLQDMIASVDSLSVESGIRITVSNLCARFLTNDQKPTVFQPSHHFMWRLQSRLRQHPISHTS